MIERTEEFLAVESATGQGANDLLDLGGDDVAADEIGVVEDGAEEALGEQVLHEHFGDFCLADLRVEVAAAKSGEVVERRDEGTVLGGFLLDNLQEAGRQLGNAVLKLLNGGLEASNLRLAVGEKAGQEIAQLAVVVQIEEEALTVLVEDCPPAVLEEGIAQRITGLDFALDFAFEVEVGRLGLPEATNEELVDITKHAIRSQAIGQGLLRDELEIDSAGGLL